MFRGIKVWEKFFIIGGGFLGGIGFYFNVFTIIEALIFAMRGNDIYQGTIRQKIDFLLESIGINAAAVSLFLLVIGIVFCLIGFLSIRKRT